MSSFKNLAELSLGAVVTLKLGATLAHRSSLKGGQLVVLGSLFARKCIKNFRAYLLLFIKWNINLFVRSWLKAPCKFQIHVLLFLLGQIASRVFGDEVTYLLQTIAKLLLNWVWAGFQSLSSHFSSRPLKYLRISSRMQASALNEVWFGWFSYNVQPNKF